MLIDELIILGISVALAVVGFFFVRWMSSVDSNLDDVNQRIHTLQTTVSHLERDKISPLDYQDTIHTLKDNQRNIQEKVANLMRDVSDLKHDINQVKYRATNFRKPRE